MTQPHHRRAAEHPSPGTGELTPNHDGAGSVPERPSSTSAPHIRRRRGSPRFSSLYRAVPAALLIYAAARAVDGHDGDHGPGLAWNVGHVAFLVAFAGFAGITVRCWRNAPQRGPLVHLAASASLLGAALFIWVILTDLSPTMDETASLPAPVQAIGPPIFIAGFAATLAAHARRVTSSGHWWLPSAIVLIALVIVGVNLDLLVVTAILVAIALQLLRRWEQTTSP